VTDRNKIDFKPLDKLLEIMDDFAISHYEEFDEELQKSFREAREWLVVNKEFRDALNPAERSCFELFQPITLTSLFQKVDAKKEQDDG